VAFMQLNRQTATRELLTELEVAERVLAATPPRG